MREFTEQDARRQTEPGLFRCAKTLYLRVKPTGSKSWVQRLYIDGRLTDLGLGSFDLVSMVDAEEKAIANRKIVYNGGNPLHEKRKSYALKFADAVRKTHADLKHQWENANTAKQWMQIMEKHALPKLGRLPVDKITQRHVIDIVKPVLLKSHETGGRLRRFIRQVFGWCQANGHVKDNVAGDAINAALPKVTNKRKNYRALPYTEITDAVKSMEDNLPSPNSKLCLLFIIHTGVRGQEARFATWDEIDLESATWTIPADHMKQGKEHRVPLSSGAIAILERARSLNNGKGLIFPSPNDSGKDISVTALLKCLKKLDLHDKTVIHGFRSTFKTWAMESPEDFRHEVIEMCLAHDVGNAVAKAYTRTDLLAKRVAIMQGWSNYISGNH